MSRMERFCKQTLRRGTSLFFIALLTAGLVLAACSPAGQTPPQYVFDDLGRLVAINGTPQRIISLAPSNTEILFALGLGDRVVGVTDWCDYPPEALEKEKVGDYNTPDIETILALNSDLILAGYGNTIEVINSLDGLGLTVFGIKTTDLDDLLDDIRTVGEITDKELEAQALTSEMEGGIQAVVSQTEELQQKPRAFYLLWGGEDSPLWSAGSDTFVGELIEKAGGANICGNMTGYSEVSLEYVVACNPQIIITSSWPGVYEWTMNSTELAVTDARENGYVYACDDNLVQRPGPRLVEGLEWFAHFIHPEIFAEPEGG
jgi:iron complex transport system substrate-binding protein